MPNWRDELKQFETEMKEHPQQEAPLPAPEAAADARQGTPVAETESKPEPKAAKEKKPASKAAGAKATTKKPAAASTSKGKKTTTKSK